MVRGRPREGSGFRVGLGVLGLTALLAIAFAPLVSPVERSGNRSDTTARWRLGDEPEAITGSMTLGEVAEISGVAIDALIEQLGLPDDVTDDDRLGRIARDNGISVADVRTVVEQILEVDGVEVATAAPRAEAPTEAQEPDDEVVTVIQEEHAEDHAPGEAGLSDVRGSMTLGEIVRLGVPRAVLFQELGLPSGTPMTDRLGRLGRTYGFTITQVRDLVDDYRQPREELFDRSR